MAHRPAHHPAALDGLCTRLDGSAAAANTITRAIRVIPIPPVLARMLRQHLRQFGTTPDGRLFRGTRGGMLSESVYGRARHTARHAALGPELAATPLARRPYDLRHAACRFG
jgi:integrase